MSNRVFLAALAAICLSTASVSAQQCNANNFAFYETGGTGTPVTISETWNAGAGGWDLTYKATVDGSELYSLRFRKTSTCGDRINKLSIITDQGTGSGGSIVVNIGVNTFGQLGYIGTIEKQSGTPSLIIGIEEIGTIGPGGVTADIIGTITAKYSASYTDYTGNILGPIRSTSGEITAVYAQRDIRGDITSATDIGIISTVGGDIGQSGNLVDISVSGNGDDIAWVRGKSIYANITTSNTAAIRGEVDLVTTTVGDFVGSLTTFVMQSQPIGVPVIDIAGDLDADISVSTIKRPVNIAGDLVSGASITYSGASRTEGPITILGDLGGLLSFNTTTAGQNDADITLGTSGTPGSILSTGKISIDKNIDGDITVFGDMSGIIDIGTTLGGDLSIGASGLKGQVNINSDNASGTWTGDVTVGLTTLSPAGSYTQTGLGGGAVGEVAFDLHLQDCNPAYSGANSPVVSGTELGAITLTHYGPVAWTGMPVKVEYRVNSGGNYSDVTDEWEASVPLHSDGRDVRLALFSGDIAFGQYRITPVRTGSNMLKCDEIAAAGNVPVAAYTYLLQYDQ